MVPLCSESRQAIIIFIHWSQRYIHVMNTIFRPLRCWLSILALASLTGARASELPFRPPDVPLVPVDPYFSIWSPGDKLTDAATTHWTETPNRLTSLVRIDGNAFRIMGNEPHDVPALPQTSLEILPTTVRYTFEGAGVRVSLTFLTPLLPEDLMVLSRPVTYLTWEAVSVDGKEHDVQIYYDNSTELVVNNAATEKVVVTREKFGDVEALKAGSVDQTLLKPKGDRVRINWGYEYVAVPGEEEGRLLIAPAETARTAWGEGADVVPEKPAVPAESPVLSVAFKLGKVGAKPVSRWLMLAYDDIYGAQLFGKNLKAYWKKDGGDIGGLLQMSVVEYEALKRRCAKFDRELMADLEKAGGKKYALACALAYRQSLAASKVVADDNGQPLFFCKEETSNGCMGTVDVFYPQSPLPLLISPSLSKAMLIPLLEYASSPRWKWPNAPHDMGTWPQANGQVYGGAKSNGGMPVEETGNMLLLVAAVAQMDGNADFATQYWPVLTKWAEYLQDYGRDPENQLCTDDFAGHLAHNANLAAKAVCALGAYGKLAAMRGDRATAEKYTTMAKGFAQDWVKQADDGDHFRLAFDQPNTWSSKYNLVWDKILGMHLFPDDVLRKEMAFYRTNLDTYGLPLDGRQHRARGKTDRMAYWSKTDWAFWTACLTDNREDFDAITEPAYHYFNETTKRVGLADLYYTDQPDSANFHSRPVIGGIFIKMLYNEKVWKKWASRDETKANGPWAAIPAQVINPVVTSKATSAPDWPASIVPNAKVHYFIADTNGVFSTPTSGTWKPTLSFTDDGDQMYDIVTLNGLTGYYAGENFMNIVDEDYQAWADSPEVDVLLQVLGNKTLYNEDGSGREVMFREGTLGNENAASGGTVPPGMDNQQWNWILLTVPNPVSPMRGLRYLGNVPNPDAAGSQHGGVNTGTLRIEGMPGITIRVVAVGEHGAFGTAAQIGAGTAMANSSTGK
jgi:hypothetical protein